MLYTLWNQAHRRTVERRAAEAHIVAYYEWRLAAQPNQG